RGRGGVPRQARAPLPKPPTLVKSGIRVDGGLSLVGLTNPSALVGLTNPRNLCYVNTCIQCLISTDVLTDFLLSGVLETIQLGNRSPTGGKLVTVLAAFLYRAQNAKPLSLFKPQDKIKNTVATYNDQFYDSEQHDIMEFLRAL
ncbi:unnamed protein product, partial [Discosporangium mesarthrocarpum]